MQFAQAACRQLLKHISTFTAHIFLLFQLAGVTVVVAIAVEVEVNVEWEADGAHHTKTQPKPIQATNELISRQ